MKRFLAALILFAVLSPATAHSKPSDDISACYEGHTGGFPSAHAQDYMIACIIDSLDELDHDTLKWRT